jgi:hypothetical protein
MSIFDREPTDWADLQNRVAQLFSELGCEAAVGATVELVRGVKEIDMRCSIRIPLPRLSISASASFGTSRFRRPEIGTSIFNSRRPQASFRARARALAALSHPHICPVFAVGRQDDIDYLVMELWRGRRWRFAKG